MKKLKLGLLIGIVFTLLCCVTQPILAISPSDVSLSAPSSVNQGQSYNVTVSGNAIGSFSVSVSGGTLNSISGANGSSGNKFVKGVSPVTLNITPTSTGNVLVSVIVQDATGGTGSDIYLLDVGDTTSVTTSIKVPTKPTEPTSPKPQPPTNKPAPKVYNMNLSALSIDSAKLSPEFNADTVDYDVELPKGTTSITIQATCVEAGAQASNIGKQEVKPGDNLIEVTTHHPETNQTKTYRLHVYVEEEPSVFMKFNNQTLGIYPSFKGSDSLDGFENTEITIQDQSVLAKKNEQGLVLLYMLGENNEKSFYVVKGEEIICKYNPVKLSNRNFISLEIPNDIKVMKGLTNKKITINEVEVEGWVFDDPAFKNYSLVYLMDEAGNIHIYQYESTEEVLQLYAHTAALSQASVDELENKYNTTRYIAYGVGIVSCSIIAGLSFLLYKNKKMKTGS